MAKIVGWPLIVFLIIAAVAVPVTYIAYNTWASNSQPDFYFGVTFGQNTTAQAKALIDKVKDYTNFFIIDSWDVATNETMLKEIADYAAESNLRFIVFFDFISNSSHAYTWHQTWLDYAKPRWGDKFLGVYLYDEPGGKQIETGQWDDGPHTRSLFQNVSSPTEAANAFLKIGDGTFSNSMYDLKRRGIPAFTSDFALYWYDYQAGYDTVFVELGWNHSQTQQLALCRGAAESFDKPWGAIITWTYNYPPYIGSGPEIYGDMVTAYTAGAKYVVVFDFAETHEGTAYSILQEEHYAAMQQFWDYVHSDAKNEKTTAEVALVLPENYGGGLRWANDNVWAPLTAPDPYKVTWRTLWPPDTQSDQIWENFSKLSDRYGLKLNVVIDQGDKVNCGKYSEVYFWNQTIP